MSSERGADYKHPVQAATEKVGDIITPQYRVYALVLLTVVYTANYVDRQILSILLEPIKQELDLSDSQLGFVTGIAFAIFYATLGVPIAMWADRGNRRNIITLALTVFSAMTAACAFVGNFWQLAAARIGVGIGEAGSSPPSHSMIADMYPPEKRATALAFFALGVNIGILLGFLIGGWVAEWYGWRAAFLIVGLPGLLLALLVRFTLREPPRGHADGIVEASAAAAPDFRTVMRFLWSQRSARHIAAGATLNSFVGYGAVIWLPAFYIRSHDMAIGDVGTALALIIGIAGGLGTFFGGYLADRLGRKDVRWNMWVVAICVLSGLPFAVGAFLWPGAAGSLAFFLVPAAVGALYLGPALAMTQGLVPLRMRAVASAMLLFIINIIGLGLGPQLVGVVSDLLRPSVGEDSLRYALLIGATINIWAAAHFYLSARTLKDDLGRIKNGSVSD